MPLLIQAFVLLIFIIMVESKGYPKDYLPSKKVQTPANFSFYQDAGGSACGHPRIDPMHEMLVAVGKDWWKGLNNPNDDPICKGVCIKITHTRKATGRNKTITVPVKDKCWGCGKTKLDLSRPAFRKLENLDVGIGQGASWRFVRCKKKKKG